MTEINASAGDFLDPRQIEKEEREARQWIEKNVPGLPEEQAARWYPAMRRRLGRAA